MADWRSFLKDNSSALTQMGAGLLSGQTGTAQLAGGLTGFSQGRQQNKTLDFLREKDPELAQLVEQGALTGGDAAKLYYNKKLESEKPKAPIEVNNRLVDANDYHVLADFSTPPAAAEAWQTVDPEEAKAMGLAPGTYQRSTKTNKISSVGGGGINIQLPGEMGARIGLGDQFLTELPDLEKQIKSGALDDPEERVQFAAGAGTPGEIWRRIETGKESLVRNLTGAGMSMAEAQNQAARYQITSIDTTETMLSKLDGLRKDLEATRNGAIAARNGTLGQAAPGARLKYNPATGKLE